MKPQARKGWWTGYVVDVSSPNPQDWHVRGDKDKKLIDENGEVIRYDSEAEPTSSEQSSPPPVTY